MNTDEIIENAKKMSKIGVNTEQAASNFTKLSVKVNKVVNVICKIRIIDLLNACSNGEKLPNKLFINGCVYYNESRSNKFLRYFSKENHSYFDISFIIDLIKEKRLKDHMTDTDLLCLEVGVIEL